VVVVKVPETPVVPVDQQPVLLSSVKLPDTLVRKLYSSPFTSVSDTAPNADAVRSITSANDSSLPMKFSFWFLFTFAETPLVQLDDI
jgi:hypothetical protein